MAKKEEENRSDTYPPPSHARTRTPAASSTTAMSHGKAGAAELPIGPFVVMKNKRLGKKIHDFRPGTNFDISLTQHSDTSLWCIGEVVW